MASRPTPGSTLPPDFDRERVAAAMAERYVEVQYVFVQFLSEHLADCAKAFGNDLEQVMILAVIGQSHLGAVLTQQDRSDRRLSYGLSALRVADVTGIPRETTRRKLAKLAKRGWILQEAGGWRLAGPTDFDTNARRDLAAVDRRGLERLARLHVDLTRLLAQPPKG